MAEATASDVPRGRKAAQRGAATMSLHDFILANYPLLAAVGAFTALATFVSNNALGQPWLATYLRFLFIVAAAVLALELMPSCPRNAGRIASAFRPGRRGASPCSSM